MQAVLSIGLENGTILSSISKRVVNGILFHQEVEWLLIIFFNQQNTFNQQLIRQSIVPSTSRCQRKNAGGWIVSIDDSMRKSYPSLGRRRKAWEPS